MKAIFMKYFPYDIPLKDKFELCMIKIIDRAEANNSLLLM